MAEPESTKCTGIRGGKVHWLIRYPLPSGTLIGFWGRGTGIAAGPAFDFNGRCRVNANVRIDLVLVLGRPDGGVIEVRESSPANVFDQAALFLGMRPPYRGAFP